MSWAGGEPMPSRRASVLTPRNATQSSTVHHSRWMAQSGSCTALPSAKKGPIGNR